MHDSYEIAVMHPKAAPCAGLGLASHDALGVTDFHGGIQPNRALICVLPLVLSLVTVSMHRQVPGVERYDVECAGLENLSLSVTSCQIRSEEANGMLQQRHRRDCPQVRALAVQHISSSGTAATAPQIRALAVQHISSSGTAATAPQIRALAVQHISSSGTAATACPVRASGGMHWRRRQRRDRLPRPGIRRGVLAAAAAT
ncbi:hypothetical protein EHW66_16830 [Erwinia psidii]|uniref:hypothetical protein n=1 Tax=Erwinia psidii TaxID=69224 RepID=UPI00226B9CD1|nr:hypothetical protein [Erwinia psidii]MCX8966581.1 hypothetical protein [Erwinia psidii]